MLFAARLWTGMICFQGTSFLRTEREELRLSIGKRIRWMNILRVSLSDIRYDS